VPLWKVHATKQSTKQWCYETEQDKIAASTSIRDRALMTWALMLSYASPSSLFVCLERLWPVIFEELQQHGMMSALSQTATSVSTTNKQHNAAQGKPARKLMICPDCPIK